MVLLTGSGPMWKITDAGSSTVGAGIDFFPKAPLIIPKIEAGTMATSKIIKVTKGMAHPKRPHPIFLPGFCSATI
jgi:hypothetical protein